MTEREDEMDIQLEVKEINELENGGAEILVNLDANAYKYLLNYAILELLKKGLYEVDNLWKEKDSKNDQ